jgi:hypothetical protein
MAQSSVHAHLKVMALSDGDAGIKQHTFETSVDTSQRQS